MNGYCLKCNKETVTPKQIFELKDGRHFYGCKCQECGYVFHEDQARQYLAERWMEQKEKSLESKANVYEGPKTIKEAVLIEIDCMKHVEAALKIQIIHNISVPANVYYCGHFFEIKRIGKSDEIGQTNA